MKIMSSFACQEVRSSEAAAVTMEHIVMFHLPHETMHQIVATQRHYVALPLCHGFREGLEKWFRLAYAGVMRVGWMSGVVFGKIMTLHENTN